MSQCKCFTSAQKRCTRATAPKAKYCRQHKDCKRRVSSSKSYAGKTKKRAVASVAALAKKADDSFDTQVAVPPAFKGVKYVYGAGGNAKEVRRFYMIPHDTPLDLYGIVAGKRKRIEKGVPYRKLMRQKKRPGKTDVVLAGQYGKYDRMANLISTDARRDVLELSITNHHFTDPPQVRKDQRLVQQLPNLSGKQADAIYDNDKLVYVEDVVKAMK